MHNALADDLLNEILNITARSFEQLVVDLMIAMGYGGSNKEAGQTTPLSNDSGVDGIINEDKLGLERIYLQAKRYRDTKVGRRDIQAFAGALEHHKARKGVFITTSNFSKEAIKSAGRFEKRIVLINGDELTALMIEHNVWVTVRQNLAIKELNTNYFVKEE